MRRYVEVISFIVLSCVLTSCSYFHNRDTEYLNAKSVPPLRIPPGISSSTIQSKYPVSDTYYPNSNQPINVIPPGLNKPGK
jgi:uncharacterized lipoprotein